MIHQWIYEDVREIGFVECSLFQVNQFIRLMDNIYLIKTPTSRNVSLDKAFLLVKDLYVLLRENVLKRCIFSYQEVCLFLDCFIKMRLDINIVIGTDFIDSANLSNQLINLYENEYKAEIDRSVESAQLYSVPNFKCLVQHLVNENVLGKPICLLTEEIAKRQQDYDYLDEDDFDSILNYHSGISPNDCLDILAGYKKITEIEKPSIIRNKNVFYTVQNDSFIAGGTTLQDIETLDHYDESDLFFSGVKEFKDVCCIWPFSNGYARSLRRDGRWGFLSQETNTIYWCNENVLYADDFRCERARIQLKDGFGRYYFLDLCLNDCFNKRFTEAREFEKGIAIVSDMVCSNYRIDINGCVHPDDQERYEECKVKIRNQKSLRLKRVKNISNETYDPETDIMDSLSGYGADPESFGF